MMAITATPTTTDNDNITPLQALLLQQHNITSQTIVQQDTTTNDHEAHTTLDDNKSHGDKIDLDHPAHPDTLRVLSHNVNGLFPLNNDATPKHFFDEIKRRDIGIFGIQEINANTNDNRISNKFKRMLSAIDDGRPKSALSSSTGVLDHRSTYLPGGTAIAVRDKWASRYAGEGTDIEMGRWSYISLYTDNPDILIYFISVYRVCKQAIACTSNTTAMQQRRILLQQQNDTDPRDQCLIDLDAYVTNLQTAGHKVVIMMDANENMDDEEGALQAFVESCDLGCVHEKLEHLNPPKTYIRGNKKIDYILCSRELLYAVQQSTLLPFLDGATSDHRACVVEFHGPTLFGNKTEK